MPLLPFFSPLICAYDSKEFLYILFFKIKTNEGTCVDVFYTVITTFKEING